MASPDLDPPLPIRQLYEFDLAGYTIVRNFISGEVIEKINRIIDSALQSSFPRKFPYLHLDPVFLDLLSDKRVLKICNYWLGPYFRLDHAFGIQAAAASQDGPPVGKENLHAGPFAEQGGFRYHWFNNRSQCGLLVFAYFLEPVRKGDGGLVLVPGSHKQNFPLTGADVFHKLLNQRQDAWWIDNPEVSAGDLLIFTEAVVHGTARWKCKEHRRRNIHYSYSPGYQANRDYEQIRKYLPLARNDTEKDLLRPPYVLRFDDDHGQLGDNHYRSPVRT